MINEEVIYSEIKDVIKSIGALDKQAMENAQNRVDILTKPPGSLGRLEELAVQLAGINGALFPSNTAKRVVVMAADHGVTAEGISAFPAEVTAQMVANFHAGGAAVNVLARQVGAEIEVVDIGVKVENNLPGVKRVRIKNGTDNFRWGKAMSRLEALKAIRAGITCAEEAVADGVKILATGEMGIGNTTASSAVTAVLTGYDPSLVVGRGTGLNDEQLGHKITVVRESLNFHKPDARDIISVLSQVGGLEIAALTGLIVGAASKKIPVVIDGFISSTAALAAVKLNDRVWHYLIPSHLSAESGHALLMDYLNLKPYFNMGMRLGEGTGAVLALHLVEAASRITTEMATFEDAQVSRSEKEESVGRKVKGEE